MKEVANTKNELLARISSTGLLQEVLEQAAKDLGVYAPGDLITEQTLAYPAQAVEIITNSFYTISRQSHGSLMDIMYRADVKEMLTHQILTDSDLSEKQKAEQLSLTFLDRELLKVLTRKAWTHIEKTRIP